MARSESSREDLFAEAKALTCRLELALHESGEIITAGFRASGAASIYWNDDPAWHFNADGAIRRGFVNGRLYKAEQGKLIPLERQRDETTTTLVRIELTPAEQIRLVASIGDRLKSLRTAMEERRFDLLREQPADGSAMDRLVGWLKRLPDRLAVAASPHVE